MKLTSNEHMPEKLPEHTGRVLICGDGPSLAKIITDDVDCPVICVNRSWEYVFPDYHVTVDPEFATTQASIPKNLFSMTYFWKYNFPGVWTPKHTPWAKAKRAKDYIHFDPKDGWVPCCGIPAATQLAIWLGFTEPIYAGVDLKRQNKHWYPGGKAPFKYLEEQRSWFKKSLEKIWNRGITTWNISDGTPIPHKRFEEIFP